MNDEIKNVLNDPTASDWLKDALRSGLERDPVDAANDAEVLSNILTKYAVEACIETLNVNLNLSPEKQQAINDIRNNSN